MERSHADWTITWRQLAACLEVPPGSSDEALLRPLIKAGMQPNGIEENADKWVMWLKEWLAVIDMVGGSSGRSQGARTIRSVSPKYIAREWMLKDAYTAAQKGDFTLVKELFELFKEPYDEQCSFENKYYTCKQT